MTETPATSGAMPVIPEPEKKKRLPSPKPLAKLLPRIRPYAGALTAASVALLLSAAISLAFPRVVQGLLDSAFLDRSGHRLDTTALWLVGLFAVQAVLNFVQVNLLTATGERIVAKLRADLFDRLVHLAPGYFTEKRTGELTSRLTSDVTMLQTLVTHQLSELARQLLTLVGGIIMLTLTHPRLTGTTLLVVPVVVASAIIFGRMLRKVSTGVQDRLAEANASAEEAIGQIRTVQSFTRENYEAARYSSLLDVVVERAVKRARLRGLFFGVITFTSFGAIVAVLWQGGRLVLSAQLTPGQLVSFLLYAVFIAGAVGALASLFGSYQEAIGATQRVFELLETHSTLEDAAVPEHLALPARGDVQLDRVTFRYNEKLPDVLHEVSLRIAPGEVVALVGPSGAGKTTIAGLMPRFWDVTGGRITLDGHDVRTLSLESLRGAIGIVPQDPALFSGTVRENIAYANPLADDAAIEAAARAAHAWEFIERLPLGFETRVGERGVKLSGGQRQRLAIARVFLKNPAVVILDEATSSLDSESERLVEQAMEELLRGRSTLIIAHRLSTVLRADRVVVLEGGRVVQEGPHSELVSREGLYSKLYSGQFRAIAWNAEPGTRNS